MTLLKEELIKCVQFALPGVEPVTLRSDEYIRVRYERVTPAPVPLVTMEQVKRCYNKLADDWYDLPPHSQERIRLELAAFAREAAHAAIDRLDESNSLEEP